MSSYGSLNTGVAFGIGSGVGVVFIVLVILALISWLIFGFDEMSPLQREGAFMILIAGLTNLVSRWMRGGVVDYIDLSLLSVNLSDLIITTGAVSFVVGGWVGKND